MEVFENGNAILQPMLDQGGTIDIRQAGVYVLQRPYRSTEMPVSKN